MLLSMTGFGDARVADDQLSVAVEVRTVNNKHLKVAIRCPDLFASLESRIEKTVRNAIGRGMVSISIRTDFLGSREGSQLDRSVIASYWQQLNEVAAAAHAPPPTDIAALLPLPGAVVEAQQRSFDLESVWTLLETALTEALEKLQAFRKEEGRAASGDLQANCRVIKNKLDEVETLAPQVVVTFRDRLLERVRQLLKDTEATINDTDLIREVSVFAERCDINEEITRLKCHLDQFAEFLQADASQGRKLDFLTQEMFREVNTIGSKANNVEIAHCVVEMKSAIDRIRENVQNVE